MAEIPVRVDCYAGHRGEQTPRRLHFGAAVVEVIEVLDAWLDPDHRYFKLRGSNGAVYILRHDPQAHSWQVTMYDRTGAIG